MPTGGVITISAHGAGDPAIVSTTSTVSLLPVVLDTITTTTTTSTAVIPTTTASTAVTPEPLATTFAKSVEVLSNGDMYTSKDEINVKFPNKASYFVLYTCTYCTCTCNFECKTASCTVNEYTWIYIPRPYMNISFM